MQSNFVTRWILASMALVPTAFAETNSVSPKVTIEPPSGESLNRFGVSYRTGWNISARFKNLGGFVSPNPPGQYDDGYNFTDINGNIHGDEILTHYWGFENASQIQNDTLVLTSSSAPANVRTKDLEEDPQHGMEFNYKRQLGRSEKWQWGLETALGFTDVTIHHNRPLSGDEFKNPDAYPLEGINPPIPHSGSFEGPGPLISPDGTELPSVTVPNGQVVTGKRQFDSEIYGLRLGPYLEYPFNEKWSFSLSGGLALLYVSSDFRFQETVTTEIGSQPPSRGSGSHSKLMPGAYVGGNLQYAIDETVHLFTGVQYQAAGTYSHKENGKKAELDIGKSFYLNFGIGVSF